MSHIAKLFSERRLTVERWAVAFSVVTIGGSQVLYNLILSNPEHFPASGLFFFYVIATIQIIPTLLIVSVDTIFSRLFGSHWITRVWRIFLYLFVLASVLRQAQLLSVEPVNSWIIQIAHSHQLVWALLLLIVLLLVWYGHRILGTFFVYLTPLALVLTGLFVFHLDLFGSGPDQAAVPEPEVALVSTARAPQQLPPIFIIMWDELEYDEIVQDGLLNAQIVPNFAELAQDSTWFPNAKTHSRETEPAIMTFLTGTQLDRAELYAGRTIFERLSGSYKMHLYEEKAILARKFGCVHPAIECRGELYTRSHFPFKTAKWALVQTENLLVPHKVSAAMGFVPKTYEPQIDRVIEDISTSGGTGQFYYWHAILPHSPYIFNPDGTKHKPGAPDSYRKQVQFTDRLLGRFVTTLKAEGLYDNSILVVTTDHGLNQRCPCSIPTIIRIPGHSPTVSDADYSHADFVPTLLDILDIPIDADDRVGGESVFAK